MAIVVQVEDFLPTVFTYAQDIPFDRSYGRAAAVPFGQAIFDEKVTLDAVASGNTGSANLGLFLPKNYCAMLRSLHLSARDANSTGYDDAVFGMAYQLPGGPYKNSAAALPETDFLYWPLNENETNVLYPRDGVIGYYKNWQLGGKTTNSGTVANPGIDNPLSIPMWVSADYPMRNCVIVLNGAEGVAALDCRLNVVFDLYTLEDAHKAEVMSSPRILSA